MSERTRRVVERLVALALGLVLLRSAAAHAGNPYHFLSTVYSYQSVGPELGRAAAATLPAVQVTLALCLLLGWWGRGAYLAAFALFAGFVAAQAAALHRGLDISCGCFGAADSLPVGPATLAVAGGCAAAAAVGFVLSRPTAQSHNEGEPCAAPTGPDSR